MLTKLIKKILGDPNEKELNKKRPLVEKINQLEEELQKLSDEDLKKKTDEFKTRFEKGESIISDRTLI